MRLILARDRKRQFLFAPLQSDIGRELLGRCEAETGAGEPGTIVLIEDGRCWTRSTAVLRIAGRMSGLWRFLYVLIAVPRPFRDFVYDIVARHRYKWFGKSERCFLPSPEDRERFLDGGVDGL